MGRLSVALLDSIGRNLYGDRYQSQLARELEVSDRTMRRWLARTFRPDNEEDTLVKLRRLLAAKVSTCEKLIQRLDE